MCIGYLSVVMFCLAVTFIATGCLWYYAIDSCRIVGTRLCKIGACLMKAAAGLLIGIAISVTVFNRFELGFAMRVLVDSITSAIGLLAMFLPWGFDCDSDEPK